MGDPVTHNDRRVLLTLDPADPGVGRWCAASPGMELPAHRDFAAAWVKRCGEGKVFYASFGHIVEPFENPAIIRFYPYALGDLDGMNQ
jgi:hypothetical protein